MSHAAVSITSVAIDQIAATSSKLDKERLVKEALMNNPLFERIAEYAYNPFKTYGIRKLPIGKAHPGFKSFDDETWSILDKLIRRELTGNAAIEAVTSEIDQLDERSAELFRRVIRKDLRAGFSESTLNKARKGLIPTFPYKRCSLPKDVDLASWPWERGVISQEKADGMFMNIDHYEGGVVAMRSRQGSEFDPEKFQSVVSDVRRRLRAGMQQHGEMVVMRDGKILPREEGNGILNSVLAGGDFANDESPLFLVWDQVPLESIVPKGKYARPYKERVFDIVRQLKDVPGEAVRLIETRVVYSLADAYAHAGELMRKGKEGTVIKHPDGEWKDGTSKFDVKLKLEFDVDLLIVAIVLGREGTKNEGRPGSLTCKTLEGDLVVDVTIKNEAMRDDVEAHPENWIGGITTVVANDIMEPGESSNKYSLFLPRMKEASVRTDKTEPDTLQRVFSIKEMAVLGQALKEAA